MSLETFYAKDITVGSYVVLRNCESARVSKDMEGRIGIVQAIENLHDMVYYKVLAPYYSQVVTLMLKPENVMKVTLESIKTQ